MEGTAPHRIILENRSHMEITGVMDLLVFDEAEIVLETSGGVLNIRGEGLHMNTMTLEKGLLVLDGDVSEMFYEEPGIMKKPKQRPFGKWMKG